ncbi:MAG: phenylacetyl-CoA:acceptor oxidoreductase subunit B PadB1, partial [Thermoleophilia bacterium]|nr:phenylacetyl-CoA:acceptor oxidoreductase subunit B PadB1 [Thermoleophilia bacterium]
KRDNRAKKYNDPTIAVDDYALEGTYEVQGVKCRPAFVLLREHLKKYTPDWAAEISTVPAGTIRRVAREFAENARIGSTIVIEGKTFPLRPVGSIFFRGAQGHTNGTHVCWALDLLNVIVGAEDVPGGCVGWPCIRLGHPDTGHANMIAREGPDGVIIPAAFIGGHDPWPVAMPSDTCKGGRCDDFWTMTTTSGVPHMRDREEIWQKLNMTAKPEMLLVWGGNLAVSV